MMGIRKDATKTHIDDVFKILNRDDNDDELGTRKCFPLLVK